MHKIFKTLFCVIFTLLIIVPLVSMPFFEENNAEKRELADKPQLLTDEGKLNSQFFSDTDSYLSDHFGFRSAFVNALSRIKDSVFKTSAENEVIIGKDNWLFFEKTLNDYMRKETLADQDMERIEKTIELINEYVTSRNAKFLFFIAPNKNSVYPDYMPYYYKKGVNASNLDKLNEIMQNKDYYINLLPLLKNQDKQIYHSLDSHWNNLGAAICFDEVMKKLGRDYTDYLSCGYDIKASHQGDLYTMLYPTGDKLDSQVIFKHTPSFKFTSRYKSEEDLTIKTQNSNKTGSLTMYRDSFCNALLPLLADEFGNAEFSRIFPYRMNLANTNQSDTVIIELVERNIKNLLYSAPVMEAPERFGLSLEEADGEILGTKKSGDLLQVYGVTEISDQAVYLSVTAKDGEKIYEAFPIYESKLIDGEEDIKSGGFSAFIPFSDVSEIDIKICKIK